MNHDGSKCSWCGTLIEPNKNGRARIYCSANCRIASRNNNSKIIKKCNLCGREFKTGKGSKKHFCSQDCHELFNRNGRRLGPYSKANYCSEEPLINTSTGCHVHEQKTIDNGAQVCRRCGGILPEGRKLFCTDSCAHRYAYRNKHPLMISVCPGCGKEFIPKRTNLQFCSIACQSKHHYREKHPLTSKDCPICGKSFVPKMNGAVYCSPNCRYVRYRMKYDPDGARNRLDGYKFFALCKIAKTRNQKEIVCEICGESFIECLTIEHMNNDGAKEKRDNNMTSIDFYRNISLNKRTVEDLQILCYNCNCSKGSYGYSPYQIINGHLSSIGAARVRRNKGKDAVR